MGIIVEFNIRISDKLTREINDEKALLGIKRFEYSAESGVIEFNDDISRGEAKQTITNFRDRLIRDL